MSRGDDVGVRYDVVRERNVREVLHVFMKAVDEVREFLRLG